MRHNLGHFIADACFSKTNQEKSNWGIHFHWARAQ
jgi:hypothetical protein